MPASDKRTAPAAYNKAGAVILIRTVILEDGSTYTRNIVNTHADGTEFLPEEFALPPDTDECERIYRALERLINAIWT